MFRKGLDIFLCSRRCYHKCRRKNLKQILRPLQVYRTIPPVMQYSTDGLSSSFDKDVLQKYFNFMQVDSSQLENILGRGSFPLQTAMSLLSKKKELDKELSNIQSLKSEDSELEELVTEEEDALKQNIELVTDEFLELIVPEEKYGKETEVEIQIIPAIGGNEAKLFAEELYHMYFNYATYKNWEILISELRGNKYELRSAYLLLSGDSVMNHIIHEAGIHRVQRVPMTEKSGRTHTSTCSISVLPKKSLQEIIIKPTEVIIDKVRSSAPGGQNVNKNETCIHLKHIPTGIRVECQTQRSQSQNLKEAYNKLRAILRQNMENKINKERTTLAKDQIKTGDYSDKIRTYNFAQNRITDHRINFSLSNVKDFLMGEKNLDLMISKVADFDRRQRLVEHIKKVLESTEYKNFESGNSHLLQQ